MVWTYSILSSICYSTMTLPFKGPVLVSKGEGPFLVVLGNRVIFEHLNGLYNFVGLMCVGYHTFVVFVLWIVITY